MIKFLLALVVWSVFVFGIYWIINAISPNTSKVLWFTFGLLLGPSYDKLEKYILKEKI